QKLSILLLSLFVVPIIAVDLVEVWDCGTEASKLSKIIAEGTLKQCPLTKDNINMCCKDHDYCYETHELTNFTREYCDFRFCGCLQDAEDLNNNKNCTLQLNMACKIVRNIGGVIFPFAHPKNFTKKFGAFVDARPLGLDMQTLVNECINAKGMAVHCHNTVHRCLERNEEKDDGSLAEHSHEDCRSNMYECLQIIGDTNDTEPCPSLAKEMSKKLNIYTELSSDHHGQSIIDVYPIVSARLLYTCKQSTEPLEFCLKTFDECARDPVNRHEKPESYNVVRRIKIDCHRGLRECIEEATREDEEDECVEARLLAVSRIREHDFEERSVIAEGAKRVWNSISSPFKKLFSRKIKPNTTE
ncbi:hypothetical protein PFISCL1PPCAC_2276, partial [Pristionchus fissidentatus]